jgi:Ca2+-binding RTX toxin-like protein
LVRRSLPRLALVLAALALTGAASAALAAPGKSGGSGGAPLCLGAKATIVSSASRIVGTKAPDTIVVQGGGAHGIEGLGGNDRICGGPGNDAIDAGRGVDQVDGGKGVDQIVGYKGPDRLFGGPDEDFLDGQQGSDVLIGGSGNDFILGEKGNDHIEGGIGDDSVDGGPGDDDPLEGGPGTDTVIGGTGIDHADGGPGSNDVVRGDAGPDVLSGGTGRHDIVSYASATRRGVNVNLRKDRASGDGHDSLGDFEDAVGSSQGDVLRGDGAANSFDGGVGDDLLLGGGGGGAAFGGPGSDGCAGFAVMHSCGPEAPPPADSAYVLLDRGLDGSRLIVQGGPGPDQIRIAVGEGSWTVTNTGATIASDGCRSGAAGVITCGEGLDVSLIVATGGAGDDSIAIDPSVPAVISVRINGNNGSDTLVGGPGNDTLEAGENYEPPDFGADRLEGGGGGDVLYADPGGDVLSGGSGNDLMVSSVPVCEGHTYEGGPGVDTVSYARANAGVRVSVLGVAEAANCGLADHLLDAESLEGSDSDDVLIGDEGRNSLLGHKGADTLIAKGGQDYVDANDGQRDTRIDCGAGEDEVLSDGADPAPVHC